LSRPGVLLGVLLEAIARILIKANHGPVGFPLLVAVARLVDDLHLLDDRALARLAGTQQQQLDLPLRSVMVCFELNVEK